MKISKLFHYLYATLMFLPIMFFLPSCIYYGFNEHANANITQDTKVNLQQLIINGEPTSTDNYSTSADSIDFVNSGIIGNSIEVLSDNNTSHLKYTQNLSFNTNDKIYISFVFYSADYDNFMFDIYGENYDIENVLSFTDNGMQVTTRSLILTIQNSDIYNEYVFYSMGDETGDIWFNKFQIFNLTQIFGSGNEPTKAVFEQYLTQPYYEYGQDYEITISKGYNISDSINEAWLHVWDLPFFAWTKNSFISQPFTYITGLFGLAANNSLNYIITWFASVSIIWLCFDVVMYVPNLAHRWLDRGALQ